MSSVESFRRLLSLHPSPNNGITFCQGNFALMPEVIDATTSIPDLIRELGTENIPFVHFRTSGERWTTSRRRSTTLARPACRRAWTPTSTSD